MRDDFNRLDVPMPEEASEHSEEKSRTEMRKRLKSLADTQGYLKEELEQCKLDMLYHEQQRSKRLDTKDRSAEFKEQLTQL